MAVRERPPQTLWRKGVAMAHTQPWCLVPAFGAPSHSLPRGAGLWQFDETEVAVQPETATATEEKNR